MKMLTRKEKAAHRVPMDVITVIILRLLVQYLLRFKSVSKAWHRIITNHEFAKLHRKIMLDSNPKQLILFDRFEKCYSCNLPDFDEAVEIYSLRRVANDHIRELHFKIQHRPIRPVIESSNGLLCLMYGGKLLLSNPCTRTHMFLPWSNPPSEYDDRDNFSLGFGYDWFCYDYMILAIKHARDGSTMGMVCSLNSNSWRTVGPIPIQYKVWSSSVFVFVNDALHALGQRCDIIVRFNIHDETWGNIVPQLPNQGGTHFRLSVLDDHLCLVVYETDTYAAWAMKGYGAKDSWERLHCIPHGLTYYEPICIVMQETWFSTSPFSALTAYDSDKNSYAEAFSKLSPRDAKLVLSVPVKLSMKSKLSIRNQLRPSVPRQEQVPQ